MNVNDAHSTHTHTHTYMHTEQTHAKSFSAEEQVKMSAFPFDDLLDKQFRFEKVKSHGDEEEDETQNIFVNLNWQNNRI